MSNWKKRGKAEEDQPRDSSSDLLAHLKRSGSDAFVPAVTDEEISVYEKKSHGAESRIDSLRDSQIVAWNNMAEQMIRVVQTIKRNEQNLQASEQRMRRLVVVVLLAILFAGPVAVYYNIRVVRSAEHLESETKTALAELRERQDRLLSAIAGLAAAQAVGIEVGISWSPVKEKEAKVAALEAQQQALEVQAESATTAEQPALQDKLDKVKKKAEEARDTGPRVGDDEE